MSTTSKAFYTQGLHNATTMQEAETQLRVLLAELKDNAFRQNRKVLWDTLNIQFEQNSVDETSIGRLIETHDYTIARVSALTID